MDIFANIWDWLSETVQNALEWVVNLLPDSPFKMLSTTPIAKYLKYINWIIPIDFMINVLTLWLVAIAAYYVWSVVLRWIKAID